MSDLFDRLAQLSPEKRALLARRLAETGAAGPRVPEPIAIVGLGCRFPGADGVDAYWRLLTSRADAISEVPADRWNASELYDADPAAAGKVATRWGGFLSGIDRFDPYFFGISPREASRMDPQQRLWLEVAWEAFEHAGLTLEALEGSRTGVFLGLHSHSSDYFWLQLTTPERMDAFTGPGNAHNIAAGRLAYLLDLRGPAVTVDTACSASLVAIHMACQSLRGGDCRTAIAGGVNAMLSPIWSIPLSRMQMLSPTGRCRAFDASADGFVRGEGAGAVVLKRLSDAAADGDTVLAVIRGSAVNQDGRTNGITAPNGLAQRALLRDALKNAGVRAADVTHVEAHGTGTAVGDPIELEAIAEVLGEGRTDAQPCWLGAVKSNFGHLEGAAGVAGLIKVVLSLQRRQIPPVCHFTTLNPGISVDLRQFPVPTRVEPWAAARRIAGVSSFGWSGTNVHVVVEDAPEQPAADAPAAGPSVLTISARSDEAVRESAARHREFLASDSTNASVRDICRTAAVRRSHFEHRLCVVGDSRNALADALESFLAGGRSWTIASGKAKTGRAPSVAFVYSGQGPQWAGMGRELLEREPVFRRAMEHCDALVTSITAWSVIDELSASQERSRLDRTAVAQPVLFSLQMALTELWKSWGIRPAAVVGHSVGEIAAAWCAGALSLEQAARIAVLRGEVMDRATGQGRMLSVDLPVPEIRKIVTNWRGLDVAAINGPRSVVLSGDTAEVERAATLLTAHDVVSRSLPVQYAFHSHQMEALAAELVRALGDVPAKDAEISFVSTVIGDALAGRQLGGKYWGRNVRETVRFADAIASLSSQHPIFLEIGPHPVLRQSIADSGLADTRVASSLHRGRDARAAMFANLGSLHAAGCAVDWPSVFPGPGSTVALPSYPWQRERYWLEHIVPYSSPGSDPRLTPGGPGSDPRLTPGASGAAEGGADGLLYTPVWEPGPAGAEPASMGAGRWLIFSDRGGVGARLVTALQRAGQTCVVEYAKRSDASGINPADREAVAAACLRLATPGGLPWRGIVHLWSLDAAQDQNATAPALEQAQLDSCGAVLGIVQALTLVGSVPPLWIVTSNAQAIADQRAAASPAQAPVWGLARTLAIEHPTLRCVRVDLPADAQESIASLTSELFGNATDDEVAFRGGTRYVPRLRRVSGPPRSALAFDANATYLVTGGLGAIGLATADWLVARGARHLVLTGRSGANEAAEARLSRPRSAGASIDVVRADVSRKEDVDRLIAGIANTPYPLKGIFHSAGVLDDGVALQQDWNRLRKVLAPKLKGAWNLHLASAGLPLDCFVLYSSLASLLGSAGQSNYAAGNAFLDALAHLRRSQSLAALSVNWGAWGGAGMAAALDAAAARRLAEAGIRTMDAEAAFAGLDRAMTSGLAQVGVLSVDWDRYARYRGAQLDFFADLPRPASPVEPAVAATPFLPDLLRDAPEERRRALILQHVRREALTVLGVPPSHTLDDEQGLRDAGLDSLMALELKNRLQAATGLTLPTTLAFDYPTTSALTDFVAGLLGVTTPVVEEIRPSHPSADRSTADLESISEDEAAALLAEELAALQRARSGASGVKRG
jgi:acyl transferase domain-containing protein